MTTNTACWIALLAVLALSPCEIIASAGAEGAAFLQIPVGAGPAALGSAYSALATDAYAPVWNPAGLGRVSTPQVAAQHLSYLETIHYEFLALALPVKEGRAFGLSAQYLGSGAIAGFNDAGDSQSSYSSNFGAYSLAYGQAVGDSLSLGVTGKFLQAKISDVSALAFAEDVGGLYKVDERISVAVVAANIPWPLPWPRHKLKFLDDDSSLPLALRAGAAYQAERRLQLSADAEFPKSGGLGGRLGAQWRPVEMLALRVGYRTDNAKELGILAQFSAGIGFTVWGQEFSYAWAPYGDLGDAQYFSFLIRFGKTDKGRPNLSRSRENPS